RACPLRLWGQSTANGSLRFENNSGRATEYAGDKKGTTHQVSTLLGLLDSPDISDFVRSLGCMAYCPLQKLAGES
ncbi:hypothetical protein EMPG_14994, partial [Blastomyces silverae]